MQILEETSFSITVKPYYGGAPVTPTTARYKIEDITNKRTIRAFTALTADSEMTIAITPDDNVILTDSNRVERRQLQVQTDYDTDDQKVGVFEWEVKNLA